MGVNIQRLFDTPLQYPGARSRYRTQRLKAIYGVVALLGLALSLLSDAHGLQAFGLGLIFPGGGFVHYAAGSILSVVAHWLLFAFSVLLFGVALFVWFWNGNIIAPIGIWFLTAIAAGAMNHHHTLPGSQLYVIGLVVAFTFLRIHQRHRAQIADYEKRTFREKHMRPVVVPVAPVDSKTGLRLVKEMSEEDLAALRFALDRALQPIDEWNGFYWGDQWQPPATRYQVNTLGWALALATHNCLPSMRGYLQQAQLNLIEKKKDHRLWWYWRWENLWGNLNFNADPMPIDNIMYSGYLGMQIGMYQAATGDLRHDEPGNFTLKHPNGETYVYDYPAMTEIVARQFDCDYCLWPCEPNWVYSWCNTTGAMHLKAYDTMHGTHYWDKVKDRYERLQVEEFTTPAGDYVQLRSHRTGLSIPALNSSTGNLQHVTTLNGVFPERMATLWEMSRVDIYPPVTQDEERKLNLDVLMNVDVGNGKVNRAFSYGQIMMSAAEQGDDEIYQIAKDALDRECPPIIEDGVLRHKNVSVWGNAVILMGRVGAIMGHHDLVAKGSPKTWLEGPLLTECNYPDVLVAKAVSDGKNLELVFYPGRSPGEQIIGISQLIPGSVYRVEGALESIVTADAQGNSQLHVVLSGRTPVSIVIDKQ